MNAALFVKLEWVKTQSWLRLVRLPKFIDVKVQFRPQRFLLSNQTETSLLTRLAANILCIWYLNLISRFELHGAESMHGPRFMVVCNCAMHCKKLLLCMNYVVKYTHNQYAFVPSRCTAHCCNIHRHNLESFCIQQKEHSNLYLIHYVIKFEKSCNFWREKYRRKLQGKWDLTLHGFYVCFQDRIPTTQYSRVWDSQEIITNT